MATAKGSAHLAGDCHVNRNPLPSGWTEDHSVWEPQGSITTQPTEAEKWGLSRKEGGFDFMGQLVYYQGAQTKLP